MESTPLDSFLSLLPFLVVLAIGFVIIKIKKTDKIHQNKKNQYQVSREKDLKDFEESLLESSISKEYDSKKTLRITPEDSIDNSNNFTSNQGTEKIRKRNYAVISNMPVALGVIVIGIIFNFLILFNGGNENLVMISLILGIAGRIFAFNLVPRAMRVVDGKRYNDILWFSVTIVVPGIALGIAWIKALSYNKELDRLLALENESDSTVDNEPLVGSAYSNTKEQLKGVVKNKAKNEESDYETFARIMQKNFGRIPSPDSNEFKQWKSWNESK